MPGMRILADLRCDDCDQEYYGDLPSGHGLCFPMLLNKTTGEVWDQYQASWFASWLHVGYRDRQKTPVPFTSEEFRPIRQPIVLNCLDAMYGHGLLKLVHAQHYLDYYQEYDLIVIVPRWLRWLVPQDVAAIWTIDLPLRQGHEWNDWIAQEIQQRLAQFDHGWLASAYAHSFSELHVERFTQIQPFPIEEWDDQLNQLTVTFIWREDRLWVDSHIQQWRDRRFPGRLGRMWKKLAAQWFPALQEQTQQVIQLAEQLRQCYPQIRFVIAGLGKAGGLPDWITDLRTQTITEDVERSWCELYAQSQVIVGIHGSNMLLPSAHAATVIELMPNDRLGNVMQDLLLIPEAESRFAVFRYRFVPLESSPQVIAATIKSMIQTLPFAMIYLKSFQQTPCFNQPEVVTKRYRQSRLRELARPAS